LNRLKRISVVLCIVAVVCVSFVPVAQAAPPLVLNAQQLTDDAGAVPSAEKSMVTEALDRLNAEHDIQLFVVYVASFDGMDSVEWANRTAELNGLGINDILLAVAVNDRQYAWSVGQEFGLTDAQLEEVATDSIEPALQKSDWAGAAIGAADGYGAALAAAAEPAAPASENAKPASLLGCLLPAGIVAIIGGVIAFFASKRRKVRGPVAASATGELDTKSLETKAGQLLVAVDDALRTSEQELGFAEAEFGADAVKEYATALADSKKQVAEAFGIQQKVYDAEPEDEPTRREMLKRIIELSEQADARLDEKAEGFARLRNIAGRADEVLGEVTKRLTAAEGQLAGATATLGELKAAYLPAALGEVADDDVEAKEAMAFARAAIERGTAASASGDSAAAAIATREAEDAVVLSERLIAAVAAAREQLAQAGKSLVDESLALEQAAAAAEGVGTPELGQLAVTARRVAAEARAASGAPPFDPIAHLAQVRSTAEQLNAALGAARDAAAQAAAARAAATSTITTARDRIASADAFIATRSGVVGAQARSALGEASTRLARAESLLATDVNAALAEAQSAQQYAESAARYAQSDVAAHDRSVTPSPPSAPRPSTGSSDGWGRAAGAILGGGMSSGRRSSGGFGGSSRGSSGTSRSSSSTRRGGGGRF